MEKEYLIKITLALYRVTEFFPKKEPLKFFLREKSNQILNNVILFFPDKVLKDINILQTYFEIAEKQNWVKRENFLVLKKEYNKIKEEILKIQSASEGFKTVDSNEKIIKQRHKKILKFLQEKKQVQVKDLKEIFPLLTKRTLRRDFDYLLKAGLVKRIGQANGTLYQLEQIQ